MTTTQKWILGGFFALVIIIGVAIYNSTKQTSSSSSSSGGTNTTYTGGFADILKNLKNVFKGGSGTAPVVEDETIECYNADGAKNAAGRYDEDGFPSPDCGFGG